ncbi:IST1-like protein [Ananas comosus]|uniref:IST1-like protein n=1 Tax=Ananas comosus TaxID=4615 RepID=A0A199V6E6_ANACO|nr:IST1-like protein [Ananas comosus]OAY72420.1 IST1-like protein [Ananas comosus]
MSMLDSFFSKGAFKGSKCKTLLKLTIPRIKLLRNRREIQLKQMRKDIAKLLESGQEATARIRVEHIIREENMMAAQEILELFCELIAVRLPIIETQKECPLDLKEAISSICFAAPRCADLPELQQVQMLFAAKYGKEFVTAATELLPDCGVNRQIIELLSVRAPSVEAKLKLLKEIAEEHELDWDPSATETEFLKPHEDLLNGPTQFTNGSTLSLPKEKHEDTLAPKTMDESHDEPDSDVGFDSLDLPEVPKVLVQPNSDIQSAQKMAPHFPASPSVDSELGHEVSGSTQFGGDFGNENKQFIPFMSPPSFSSAPIKQINPEPWSPPYSSPSTKQSEPESSPPSFSSISQTPKLSEPFDPTSLKEKGKQASSPSRTKSGANVDLQDVLAAARTAAETAERAATAARAAANLAQIRISDLVAKRHTGVSDGQDGELQSEYSHRVEKMEKPVFDKQDSFSHVEGDADYKLKLHDVPEITSESFSPKEQVSEFHPSHAPQRLGSLEDDPYFSYPNLFTSQGSKP